MIHVSLAATHTDLRQHHRAVEHYRQEVRLRQGNPKEVNTRSHSTCLCIILRFLNISIIFVRQECETWLNIAVCQEEMGDPMEKTDASYTAALSCAERSGVKQQVGFCLHNVHIPPPLLHTEVTLVVCTEAGLEGVATGPTALRLLPV